jgi:hypothetical protein
MPGKFGRYKPSRIDHLEIKNPSWKYEKDDMSEMELKDTHAYSGILCRRGDHNMCVDEHCNCRCHAGNNN